MERIERVPERELDVADGGAACGGDAMRKESGHGRSLGDQVAQTHRISALDRGRKHVETLDPPSSVGLITARQDQFLLHPLIVGGRHLEGVGFRARIGLDRDPHEAECALDLALGVAGESEGLGWEIQGDEWAVL